MRVHARKSIMVSKRCLTRIWLTWAPAPLKGLSLVRLLSIPLACIISGGTVDYFSSRLIFFVGELFDDRSLFYADPSWSPFRNTQSVDAHSLPLRTSGRSIVDQSGQRVRLRCVNWYGAHMSMFAVGGLDRRPLQKLVTTIRAVGFNCVRLPYSLELQLGATQPSQKKLAANPDLFNKTGLELLDATVDALAALGLLIVLNNHQGQAIWCCTEYDGEGLWYTQEYPEEVWLASLTSLAARYRHQPYVVGYDIRNEPRGVIAESESGLFGATLKRPTWGDGHAATDWAAAAIKGSVAVTQGDPDALLVVEGVGFATDLRGVKRNKTLHQHPALLGRVVYEVHDYCWYHTEFFWAWVLHWVCIGCTLLLGFQMVRRKELMLASAWRRRSSMIVCIVCAWMISCWLSSYSHFEARLSEMWGFIVDGNEAPVWLGEFGTNGIWVTDSWLLEIGEVIWWRHIMRYIRERDLDYAYWALNGDKGGDDETFGILDSDYASLRHPWVLEDLLY